MFGIPGCRRAHGALLSILPVAAGLALPAGAGAAEPIVGTWDSEGAQVRVDELGPNRIQGTVISGSWAACPGTGNGPGGVVWKNMSGGGFGYSGSVPWLNTDTCGSIGNGFTTWGLTDYNSGVLTSTDPSDGSHKETSNFTRVGDWSVTAFVQNIINNIVKPTYDPCDYGAVAGGAANNDCGQKGLRGKEQFWKANGSVICATGTVLSGSKHFTVVTTPASVTGCVKGFPPPKRAVRAVSARPARHAASVPIKGGTYKGFSVSLAAPGQNLKHKQVRRKAKVLAKFLAKHRKPHGSSPISFKVAKKRATTFSASVSLNCEDGSSLPVDLTDLPDPTAPLTVPKSGYFRLGAENDPGLTARIGGDFLAKRSVAGTLYVGGHFHQHGLCDSWVGFAARKG